MRDGRILKIGNTQWRPAPFAGANTSGYVPVGDKVLILPDVAVTKTAGGILLTDEKQEQQTASAMTGILVEAALGAFLWNDDRTAQWEGARPLPGQRIYFERYAGQILHGKDGQTYRLMDQRCIAGIEVEPAADAAEAPRPAAA